MIELEVKIDTDTMMPTHEAARVLRNAKRLIVKAGGKEYTGLAIFSIDDEGTIWIEYEHKKKAKTKKLPDITSFGKAINKSTKGLH